MPVLSRQVDSTIPRRGKHTLQRHYNDTTREHQRLTCCNQPEMKLGNRSLLDNSLKFAVN